MNDSQTVERYDECKKILRKHGLKIKPNSRFFDVHDGNDLIVFSGDVNLVLGFAKGIEFTEDRKKPPRRKK
jgi:hypothetical protein